MNEQRRLVKDVDAIVDALRFCLEAACCNVHRESGRIVTVRGVGYRFEAGSP